MIAMVFRIGQPAVFGAWPRAGGAVDDRADRGRPADPVPELARVPRLARWCCWLGVILIVRAGRLEPQPSNLAVG